MREALREAELARGRTGDNPWVGCVLVDEHGQVLARGRTQGPGEDHAEIVALQAARAQGVVAQIWALYSTLEPCSFHGRTPACSRVIVDAGVPRVVLAMRDPHPRVDGQGAAILRRAGVEVVEGVCEAEVRRQLGPWVLAHHPHDVARRAQGLAPADAAARLAPLYDVTEQDIERVLASRA